MSWETKKLGNILKISTGKYDVNHSVEDGVYPFFTCAMIPFKSNTFSFDDEVILLPGNGANVGEVMYYKGKLEAYQRTYVLHKIEANVRYVYYFLKAFWRITQSNQQYGSATNYIRLDNITELQIPLPSLPIQKRIAEILDAADELKRKDQELLKKYDELAQSIFIDMFGDPVRNEKGWEVKKLDDACIKITDGTHFSPPNQSEGIPYITAKHIKKDFVDFYSKPSYIAQQYHDEIFSRCTPEKGDILYIKDGATTGIAAVNEYDFEFSMLSSLALLKPNKELLNSYYLSFYLNDEIVKQNLIREYMAGAAIKRFTLDKIKNFKIIMPPIKLQNEFEKRWKTLRLNVEILKKFESKELFNSLIQKAFKSELV